MGGRTAVPGKKGSYAAPRGRTTESRTPKVWSQEEAAVIEESFSQQAAGFFNIGEASASHLHPTQAPEEPILIQIFHDTLQNEF